jgi:hypothetical protein
MSIKSKTISSLDLTDSLTGLSTLGTKVINGIQTSVRVSLELLQTAYNNMLTAIGLANTAVTNAKNATDAANTAATAAQNAAAYAAQQAGAINGIDRKPATLYAIDEITVPVGSSPVLLKKLYPESANQSVVFQVYSGTAQISPDGTLTSQTVGDVIVNVISTESSVIWRQITVHVRALEARIAEDGTARTSEDGTAIEC